MRKIALTLALAAAVVTGAWANGSVVYLDEATLEQLRTSNPIHYARAQKILAAADHLCKPKPNEIEYAQYGAKDLACLPYLVKTSNPPKREIRFKLNDTQYIALVVLTDDPARLVQVSPQR